MVSVEVGKAMKIWVVLYGSELERFEAWARREDAEAARLRKIEEDGSQRPEFYHVVEVELRFPATATTSAAVFATMSKTWNLAPLDEP